MKNKATILIVSLTVAVIGVALWQTKTLDNSVVSISNTETVSSNESSSLSNAESSIAHSFSDPQNVGVLSEGDIRDINLANDQSIANTEFLESDYAKYDEATLQKMADSGDVTAMKALWLKYLKSDDANDAEKMRPLVTKAIVYGDRDMFKHMPELSKLSDQFTNPEASTEEKHSAMIDILAYHEFMGLRGNLGQKYSGQEVFFLVHSTPEAPIKLTASDKTAIIARAKEIYANYEGERIKLGLGPFDNSVPEGLAKMYEMQRVSYLQALGENAI